MSSDDLRRELWKLTSYYDELDRLTSYSYTKVHEDESYPFIYLMPIIEQERERIMAEKNDAMLDRAKELVVKYFNEQSERTDNFKLTKGDVFIVWFCKTLQNWKAMVSTTVSDGMYYEVTHNGDKGETYLDAYKKWKNVRYPDA